MMADVQDDAFLRLAQRYDDPAAVPSLPTILKHLVTEREAELLLFLPGTPEEVCQRSVETPSFVEATLLKCFRNGMIVHAPGSDGTKRYAFVDIYVDSICADPRNNAHGSEYRALWRQWTDEQKTRMVELCRSNTEAAEHGFPVRILPEPQNLEHDHEHYVVVPLEDARSIIEKSRCRVVVQCSCRFRLGDCDYPKEDICMMLDHMGEYCLERGFGKDLSKKDALDILTDASKAGLVHLSSEHFYEQSQAGTEYICNCCPCCCVFLKTFLDSERQAKLIANYYAAVDAKSCTGCGACITRCHFDAISLKEDKGAVIEKNQCAGCGLCIPVCRFDAVHLRRKGEDEYRGHPVITRHSISPRP